MIVRIKKGKLSGRISAPPSKSYAHRMLLLNGALGGGSVSGLDYSKDIEATLSCLSAFGSIYEKAGDKVIFKGLKDGGGVFDCLESGSTLRFFIPLALTRMDSARFRMTPRLKERGIGEYEKLFSKIGIEIKDELDGFTFTGRLAPGEYEISVAQSSQYASGLLFALAILGKPASLRLLPPIESRGYLDITLSVLNSHGAGISFDEKNLTYHIPGNRLFTLDEKPFADASNAAFLEGFAYLGEEVVVDGLDIENEQGDYIYKDYFPLLKNGCPELDIRDCIDLGPILFAFAAFCSGAKITGIKRLRIKESDRAEAMKEELAKVGAKVTLKEDEAIIEPATHAPTAPFSSHNDHRIAMALSLFLLKYDITLVTAEAVAKSFPDYWKRLEQLGARIDYEDR